MQEDDSPMVTFLTYVYRQPGSDLTTRVVRMAYYIRISRSPIHCYSFLGPFLGFLEERYHRRGAEINVVLEPGPTETQALARLPRSPLQTMQLVKNLHTACQGQGGAGIDVANMQLMRTLLRIYECYLQIRSDEKSDTEEGGEE
ncbi:hypothetical protein KBA73_03580 [Patescibacteria group bacterium]|nr:hypothetical protein [Patescibacteria group bacterium]